MILNIFAPIVGGLSLFVILIIVLLPVIILYFVIKGALRETNNLLIDILARLPKKPEEDEN